MLNFAYTLIVCLMLNDAGTAALNDTATTHVPETSFVAVDETAVNLAEHSRRHASAFLTGKPNPALTPKLQIKTLTAPDHKSGQGALSFIINPTTNRPNYYTLEATLTPLHKQGISHEAAHTAFIDANPNTQDDWLNEGFATQYETHESHQIYREGFDPTIPPSTIFAYKLGQMRDFKHYCNTYCYNSYLLNKHPRHLYVQLTKSPEPTELKLRRLYNLTGDDLHHNTYNWLNNNPDTCNHNNCFLHDYHPNQLTSARPNNTNKPELLIYKIPNCLPCRKYEIDICEDNAFAKVMNDSFNVKYVGPLTQLVKPVPYYPAFRVKGSTRVLIGYTTKYDLMDRLGILDKYHALIGQRPNNNNNQQNNNQQNNTPAPSESVASPASPLPDSDGEDQSGDDILVDPKPTEQGSTVGQKIIKAAQTGFSLWTLFATGGASAAVPLALWGLSLMLKKPNNNQPANPQNIVREVIKPVPIVTETIVPADPILPTTQYIKYPVDKISEALDFAKREIAKYPGTVQTLTLLDSLMSQYLAGLGKGAK